MTTVGGRVYHFGWEVKGHYSRNLALNLPVQGTAAEIALEAMIRIDTRLQAELGIGLDLFCRYTMNSSWRCFRRSTRSNS